MLFFHILGVVSDLWCPFRFLPKFHFFCLPPRAVVSRRQGTWRFSRVWRGMLLLLPWVCSKSPSPRCGSFCFDSSFILLCFFGFWCWLKHGGSMAAMAPLVLFLFFLVTPCCSRLSPPEGSSELDLRPLFSYLRILRDRASNRDSILDVLDVSYGGGIADYGLDYHYY